MPSNFDYNQALEKLQDWLEPGSTVYTILRHVSRSGVAKEISVVTFLRGTYAVHPSHSVATVLGLRVRTDKHGRDVICVRWCNTDCGKQLVADLSRVLNRPLRQEWL